MDDEPFLWNFPCYAVIKNDCNTDPVTGDVVLDEKLRFIAPAMSQGGEQRIALFTDSHLADDFIQQVAPNQGMGRLKIGNPIFLATFLRTYQHLFQHLVVDPNPKTRIGRMFDLREAAEKFESAPQEDQDAQ
jgi:hypothetical protein